MVFLHECYQIKCETSVGATIFLPPIITSLRYILNSGRFCELAHRFSKIGTHNADLGFEVTTGSLFIQCEIVVLVLNKLAAVLVPQRA